MVLMDGCFGATGGFFLEAFILEPHGASPEADIDL
jgi:hypothetical protein